MKPYVYKKKAKSGSVFCAAADESARQRAVRCCKLERMQNLEERKVEGQAFFPPLSDVQSDGRRESVSKPSVRLNHLQLPIISERRQLCSHKAKTILHT